MLASSTKYKRMLIIVTTIIVALTPKYIDTGMVKVHKRYSGNFTRDQIKVLQEQINEFFLTSIKLIVKV